MLIADYLIEKEKLAYAAGVIDGEGCITCYQHKSRPHIFEARLRVNMTSPGPIYFLEDLFGGHTGHRVVSSKNSRKPQWQWSLGYRPDLKACLEALLPVLRVKKYAAYLALFMIDHLNCPRWQGKEVPPEQVACRQLLVYASAQAKRDCL